MTTVIFVVIVSLIGIGIVLTWSSIGKPRTPITKNMALAMTIANVLYILGMCYLYAN